MQQKLQERLEQEFSGEGTMFLEDDAQYMEEPEPKRNKKKKKKQAGAQDVEDLKEEKHVVRLGARCQTLPRPDERLFSDDKLKRVKLMHTTTNVLDCPEVVGHPEVAVVGRSNVGKSSLVNMLTLGNTAAEVSSKPGTTQQMFHYFVDNKWWLVDLPGYGFAKATQEERDTWDKFTREYLISRGTVSDERANVLAGVLLLVDASLPPQKLDLEYSDWLTENSIPYVIVFTKCDRDQKMSPEPGKQLLVEENIDKFMQHFEEKWRRLPSMIRTSSVTKEGSRDVLRLIYSFIVFKRRKKQESKVVGRRVKVTAEKKAAKSRKKPSTTEVYKPKTINKRQTIEELLAELELEKAKFKNKSK